MKENFLYLLYVLRHKWYVMRGGLFFGVSWWRLIKHDWTKFTMTEWRPYVNKFYRSFQDNDAFLKAWNHHIHWNDHHWQYWVMRNGNSLEMPEDAAREMVADWYGAGFALKGFDDLEQWFKLNRYVIIVHESTMRFLVCLIKEHVAKKE